MDHDPSTRHVLEGRELVDYLIEKAAGATGAEILQREERRNRRMAVLFSVLTFFGIGAIVGAIEMFVRLKIDASQDQVVEKVTAELTDRFERRAEAFRQVVEGEIEVQVEQRVGAVRNELQHYKTYQEFIAHAEVISSEAAENRVADQSLAHALDAITELADAPTIIRQPRFLEAAKSVIDVLVRTDRDREIDQVDSLLGQVLPLQKSASLDLADHYGELIVSSPYSVERLERESEALARYARAAREHKYPEKALMWELFVAYKSNGFKADRTTQNMVDMVRDLNENDLNEFCYQIVLNSHPLHWMTTPDHEGRELARIVNGLLRDHTTLRQIVELQSAHPSVQPRIAKLSARRMALSSAIDEAGPIETPEPEAPATTTPPSVAERAIDNRLRR